MDCKFEVKEGKMYITTDDYWYVIDTVTHSCTAISVDEVIAAQEKKVELTLPYKAYLLLFLPQGETSLLNGHVTKKEKTLDVYQYPFYLKI